MRGALAAFLDFSASLFEKCLGMFLKDLETIGGMFWGRFGGHVLSCFGSCCDAFGAKIGK